jgi:dTDP-glucose 4,6-dehydratase
MKTILVTGGAGFIGSNFVRFILRVHPSVRVVNLDALTYAGCLENLDNLPDPNRHVFVHGNICNCDLVEAILRKEQIEVIVNFAAETHVDRSITAPADFVQTNIVGTSVLLEAARKIWLVDKCCDLSKCRFHHVSTDEVYGSLAPTESAFTETTPYAPRSPYSASKAASDHLVRAYFHTFGLPVTISNCSNNYGPNQFPEKLIPLMVMNAQNGELLPVYGDGRQIRDWLYVEDHCEAIWQIITTGRVGETYNIGGNNQPTNLELINMICEIMDQEFPKSPQVPHNSLINFVTDRPGHDRRYAIDITKIGIELGWQPRQSLETGLRNTIRWYIENRVWVQRIRQHPTYQDWLQMNYGLRGKVES